MNEITPESTLRPGARGVAVVLGDGRAWLLAWAGLDPSLDTIRDHLFDCAETQGSYDEEDLGWLCVGATRLLLRCHDLAVEDAVELVRAAPAEGLARAVESAIFGGGAWSYSTWARVALMASGIRPDEVDPAELSLLLGELGRQGKTPPRQLIPSTLASQRLAGLRAMARAQAQPKQPPVEPASP